MTQERPIKNSWQIIHTTEVIMDIGDIMAVVGIFHQFLWCILCYFNVAVPCSFSISLSPVWKQFLKEPLTITLFCFSFMPADFIWSPLTSTNSRHSDESCLEEMSSHTLSIWVPFEEKKNFFHQNKSLTFPFRDFLALHFLTVIQLFVWQEPYHKCLRVFHGISPKTIQLKCVLQSLMFWKSRRILTLHKVVQTILYCFSWDSICHQIITCLYVLSILSES